MRDQAEALRIRLNQPDVEEVTKTIAVISGKGGVGKSNFSLNFSLALSNLGHRVLLFDMDIGMGNIDILMGKSSSYSIVDYFEGGIPLQDIILEGPAGLHYISGGTGFARLIKMDKEVVGRFIEDLSSVLLNYDHVIFDMGAGVSEGSLELLMSVNEMIVISTPEPTSITDAYAAMKYIHKLDPGLPFYLVVNRAHSEKEGTETLKKLSRVLKSFLGKESAALGILPDDRSVQQAVSRQIPFLAFNAKSPASKALADITKRYEQQLFMQSPVSGSFQFVSKLKRFLFER